MKKSSGKLLAKILALLLVFLPVQNSIAGFSFHVTDLQSEEHVSHAHTPEKHVEAGHDCCQSVSTNSCCDLNGSCAMQDCSHANCVSMLLALLYERMTLPDQLPWIAVSIFNLPYSSYYNFYHFRPPIV